MQKLFVALALTTGLLSPLARAASWTPAQTIPATSPTSQTPYAVNLAYDSTRNLMFAAWHDNTTQFPYFSIFDNTSGVWSAPSAIASTTAHNTVNLSYDSSARIMVATWTDGTTLHPFYSVYNGTSWSSPAAISNAFVAFDNVRTTFDAGTGNIVAAWSDNNSPFNPYYSIYNANANAWTTPQTITIESVFDDVTLAYNGGTNQVFAAWLDNNTVLPSYAILTAGVWVAGNINPANTGYSNVSLVYDTANGQVYAAWGEANPLVSVFPNADPAWSIPVIISNSAPTTSDIGLGYSSASAQVIAAWDGSGVQQYAITDSTGANWTSGVISSNPSDSSFTNLAFDAGLSTMFAAWSDGSRLSTPAFPMYSTLLTPPAPTPSFTGIVKRNTFLNRAECVLFASWTASPAASVVLYRIYQNGVVVHEINASGALSFRTCSCSANGLSGYAIAAVDTNGIESARVPLNIITC